MKKNKWEQEMDYYKTKLAIFNSQPDYQYIAIKKQAIIKIIDTMEKTRAVVPASVKREIYYKNNSQKNNYKNKKDIDFSDNFKLMESWAKKIEKLKKKKMEKKNKKRGDN